MQGRIKKINYANDEITVVWQPELCLHVGSCFTQLPEVFNPGVKKWINPHGAPTDKIIEQVNICPSGALSYFYNKDKLSAK
jgi:putative redox protein